MTNPLNATPLRPGSTFIDGFSKLIPQRIAVEISYLLVYCPWKSINKCGAGTQWRNVWWIRQDAPTCLLLLEAVSYIHGLRHQDNIHSRSSSFGNELQVTHFDPVIFVVENMIFRTVPRNIVWNWHFWPYFGWGGIWTFMAGDFCGRSSALWLSLKMTIRSFL